MYALKISLLKLIVASLDTVAIRNVGKTESINGYSTNGQHNGSN